MTVSIKDLKFFYNSSPILDIQEAQFKSGKVSALLGPSGCGKTTLLRCIAKLEQPTAGRILYGSRDISEISYSDIDLSMVFQDFALYQGCSVEKNISLALRSKGLGKIERQEKVKAISRAFMIEKLLKKKVTEISGGEMQRVSIVRSIILEPSVLLMDEPFNSLDNNIKYAIRREFLNYHQTQNSTTVIVTHDQMEAAELSDQIFLMNNGQLVQQGTYQELYEKPNSRFVAEFIGSVPINQIEVNDKMSYLRPEKFYFDKVENGKSIIAEFVRTLRIDSSNRYIFKYDDRELTLISSQPREFSENESVTLYYHPKDLAYFE